MDENSITTPKISVLMPVYNAGNHLHEAISSILNQTYTNFEFHIFNDGSSDNSDEIIKSFSDPRIVYHNSSFNAGYVVHLNHGIEIATGKYIARMDADDISLPQRFEKQIAIMEAHPEIGVCGAWLETINEAKDIYKYPHTHGQITFGMLRENPMGHPVIMMRTLVLKESAIRYENAYMPAEDFKMWASLAMYTKLYNIQEVLLKYRLHQGQISKIRKELQLTNIYRSQFFSVNNLLHIHAPENVTYVRAFFSSQYLKDINFVKWAGDWIRDLVNKNRKTKIYNVQELENFFTDRWYYICSINVRHDFEIVKLFLKYSPHKSPKTHIRSIRLMWQSLKCKLN